MFPQNKENDVFIWYIYMIIIFKYSFYLVLFLTILALYIYL